MAMSTKALIYTLMVMFTHLAPSANGSQYLFKREYTNNEKSSTILYSAAAPRARSANMPAKKGKKNSKGKGKGGKGKNKKSKKFNNPTPYVYHSSPPTWMPSGRPTESHTPSASPSAVPSVVPSRQVLPSEQPSVSTQPSWTRSYDPSRSPTDVPSRSPTGMPSHSPTFSTIKSSKNKSKKASKGNKSKPSKKKAKKTSKKVQKTPNKSKSKSSSWIVVEKPVGHVLQKPFGPVTSKDGTHLDGHRQDVHNTMPKYGADFVVVGDKTEKPVSDGHHQDIHNTAPKNVTDTVDADGNTEKSVTTKHQNGTISVKESHEINTQHNASNPHVENGEHSSSPDNLSPANLPGKGGLDSSIAKIAAHEDAPINDATSTTPASDSIYESKSHAQRTKNGMILSSGNGNEKDSNSSNEDPRPRADNATHGKSAFDGRDSRTNIAGANSSNSPAFTPRQASLWRTLFMTGFAFFVGLPLLA